MDSAGSFQGIYQSGVIAYGPQLLKDSPDPERFADLKPLQALDASGAFAGQQIAIAPIRAKVGGPLEVDPLLSKNIRFVFEPNVSKLDRANASNLSNLQAIKHLIEVSPGSTIVLRGHVDNGLVERFREQGGETLVHEMALKAMSLSKERAVEIRNILVEQLKVDPSRLQTVGRGWDEPVSANGDENRRVEVQWFTVE
jgi:NitT/TauT family transport system substrate-binding protein